MVIDRRAGGMSTGSKWPRRALSENPLEARNICAKSNVPQLSFNPDAGLTATVNTPVTTTPARIASA
jgi:hypothetical protein